MKMATDVRDPTSSTHPHPGLTAEAAREALVANGPNQLPTHRQASAWRQLAAQMTHFFALLLWGAAAMAWVGGMPQLAIAIIVVVLLNGGFAFVQEHRADKAGQRLQSLLPRRVYVRRDGRRISVAAEDLVVGDLVLLEAGDRICADLELVLGTQLAVDESPLTGESVPAHPDVGDEIPAGCFVVEGTGEAVVTKTGSDTRLASIATLTTSVSRRPGPLKIQLNKVVRLVALIAISVGAAFFAVSLLLGMAPSEGILFAVGVAVALVPEGLLPTVTLSLALGAQRMADQHALVRHLEAVETLGSTTFICTDKTGTMTRNQMSVVAAFTPAGSAEVSGNGYEPEGEIVAPDSTRAALFDLARSAALVSTGRLVKREAAWVPLGDPMEVALEVFAMRVGVQQPDQPDDPLHARFPFDPRRRRSSVVVDGSIHVMGAPDTVLPLCAPVAGAGEAMDRMAASGLRVIAIARRGSTTGTVPQTHEDAESDLELLGLLGLQDPPRDGVATALQTCRSAGIKIAMITGDHPATAAAIAGQVGLLCDQSKVIEGSHLPVDQAALGELLDHDGMVVARATPEDKLRIAQALQSRGHIVAMTGDGVNDGPALQAADIGVAMGASGTDVAREAADLVLLDDSFATIVAAVEQGRATFTNIRRFLTYHLTDNVAELTPLLLWALSGGQIPMALTVLQILALDIGTDLLPALALGAEPANKRAMTKPPTGRLLMDGAVIRRVFGVLGPCEAVVEILAFVSVLLAGGWVWATEPNDALLATASGTAFAAVVLGQLANAFACRSESRWVGQTGWRGNPLLLGAVAVELVFLVLILTVPVLTSLLGGSFPSAMGWLLAASAVPAVILVDTAHKAWRNKHREGVVHG